ncbi:DnaJ domain-containing protein [Paenibacillus alkaliterrae]|uniref:J domain-containing protein n=1 Tax=Paenibacillus alkaliterrae TaxID=320909 RepID=UPI001F1D5D15|nr:J domain-containing protein [Paenibacillus alkaliterrae]MCF2940701.1 DnaJ domain-containing protein [Paenibacillus alkaliterrae]
MTEGKRPRKPKKAKIENYYKILGVRSNATPESIKKSYIQMVKQFPPEQHPEQFQVIRRAYDTLRDPVKRKEYDFQRKYGGSITKIMEEAFEWMEAENWDKAEKLFRQALDISAEATSAHLGLLQISIMKEQDEQAEQHIQAMIEKSDTDESLLSTYAVVAKIWYDMDQPERALKYLELLMEKFPEHQVMYTPFLAAVYQSLGRADEAYFMIEASMPTEEEAEPEQFGLFINWINAMIHLGKWQYWSRVNPRVKKFLLSIRDEDDRTIVLAALMDEYLHYRDCYRFKEAELYINLALLLDKSSSEVLKFKAEIQLLQRISKEVGELPRDRKLNPAVGVRIHQYFLEEFAENDGFFQFASQMFEEMFDEMTEKELQDSLKHIKAKYKLLYARYHEQIDALIAEKASDSAS